MYKFDLSLVRGEFPEKPKTSTDHKTGGGKLYKTLAATVSDRSRGTRETR